MLGTLQQIGHRNRVVLGADLAVAVFVDDQLLAIDSVATGSLAGLNHTRRRAAGIDLHGVREAIGKVRPKARYDP